MIKMNIEKQKQERLGKENRNTFGTLMKIVEYESSSNVTIEFQDEYKFRKKCDYNKQFIRGEVRNPYDKETYNVGYIGVGKYKTKEKGKITKSYQTWKSMLQRCYDPYYINKEPAYKDCYVCKEWHCFQSFAEWWEENVYNCNNERMELDKDILVKGNKIYSPETCLIVSQRINNLFVKRRNDRGEYPIGVTYRKKDDCLYSQCQIIDERGKYKRKHLGSFPLNRPFQAFYTYKQFKENYIKQVADEYYSKGLIPKKLYDAMYKYEVEIND